MRTFFTSFQARLLGCFLVVAALSMLMPVLYVRPVLHEAMLRDSLERLRQEALLAGALLEAERNGAEFSAASAVLNRTEIRLTVMNPQGAVLFESSQAGGSSPENHADRPEVQEAMRSGQGSATRFSASLQSEWMYAARRLENGNIIRLALPFAGVKQRIDAQLTGFSLAAVAAVALSLLLAWFFSSRIKHSLAGMILIVEGISLGKFSRRLHMIPGTEFQPLADAVNRMAESMEASILAVADQKSQLEAVLETMAEGVLVLGPKGRVRRINRAFAAYFPQLGPVEGRQVVELIPSPALQEAASNLLDDPDGYGKNVLLPIALNKAVFSVLLARPLKEAADSLGLVAVFHDITELVRLESVRRDFVANVSHELRTPLTAIQGYAETLESMEDIPEQGRCFAEIIRKHGMFLSGMVEELLTLSRLESDSFRLEPAPVKPAEALCRAIKMLQAEIECKRLRITELVDPDLLAQADSALLERVFRNLLENACRYAPEESEIVVSSQIYGIEAVFTVSNQGPGIPSAELGRIFERFYQAEKHHGASRGIGGGLGLAICKHIVERHHGRIWAESPSENAATA
ncbi:MAG: ATP-binding protein, partial [Desulfovibrionaceae bacterium]|nr:ATP-binding protein [Desulfovibrionaceae bacterium]